MRLRFRIVTCASSSYSPHAPAPLTAEGAPRDVLQAEPIRRVWGVDAVAKNIIGEIYSRFEKGGLRIVASTSSPAVNASALRWRDRWRATRCGRSAIRCGERCTLSE